jgi:hypothetical protein
MLVITIVFAVMLAVAVLCALRLTRPAAAPARDVESMKTALERRIREGAEFRL